MKIVMGSNEGGLELAKNTLTSIKKVGISMSDVIFYDFKGDVIHEGVDGGTLPFNRLVRSKVEVLLDALETNEYVVWVDSDVIFLKNCLEEGVAYCSSADMVIQAHPFFQTPHCTGYWVIKSTQRSKDYLLYIIEQMKEQPHHNEEEIINNTFRDYCPKTGLVIKPFPLMSYPVGDAVWKCARYINNALSMGDVRIIHNNYIVGNQTKINRFKQFDMWHIDENILESVEHKDWVTKGC